MENVKEKKMKNRVEREKRRRETATLGLAREQQPWKREEKGDVKF
jgi:hypothetical protein